MDEFLNLYRPMCIEDHYLNTHTNENIINCINNNYYKLAETLTRTYVRTLKIYGNDHDKVLKEFKL